MQGMSLFFMHLRIWGICHASHAVTTVCFWRSCVVTVIAMVVRIVVVAVAQRTGIAHVFKGNTIGQSRLRAQSLVMRSAHIVYTYTMQHRCSYFT